MRKREDEIGVEEQIRSKERGALGKNVEEFSLVHFLTPA